MDAFPSQYMSSQYQVLTIEIDGLNLGDEIFNYKNRLLFAHPRGADDNISNAFVVLDRPIVTGMGGRAWESPENMQHAEDAEEALQLVGTFLACYSLVNVNQNLEIVFSSPSGASLSKPEDVLLHAKAGGGWHSHIKSHKKKMTLKEVLKSLNDTLPLFEKVISILDKSKKAIDPLQVALLVYHQSLHQHDMLKDFLGMVTVIESLLCNIEDLRYKFALRATLFSESDTKKRKDLFEKLNTIYGMRNKLVHGGNASMFPYVDYWKFKEELEPVVKKILLQYIELAHSGKKKDEIMTQIDDLALGII
jgi:hypothetical protein